MKNTKTKSKTVYKLTTRDFKTRVGYENETTWGPGITHKTDGRGSLCGPGWLHFYHSAELAVLLNASHADISDPVLWECRAGAKQKDDRGLKAGTTQLTSVRQIPLPVFSRNQKIAFGIYCALRWFKAPDFVFWANRWLSGKNRTKKSASAAAYAASAASAAYAASAAAGAASAAAGAASAAAYAVISAADAAISAAGKNKKPNFSFLKKCALKALKIK